MFVQTHVQIYFKKSLQAWVWRGERGSREENWEELDGEREEEVI